MFLTIGLNDSIGIVGTLNCVGPRGWHFISYTQRGNSRKLRDTPEKAIPKWFTGYMVDVARTSEAEILTKHYRDGLPWAVAEALAGKIKMVHKGRIT